MSKIHKSFRFTIAVFAIALFALSVAVTAQSVVGGQNLSVKDPARFDREVPDNSVVVAQIAGRPEDATNYTFATSTNGTFTDMTGSTQLLGPANDDIASAIVPIGFDFWLLGNRYTNFNVNSNGMIGLSATGTGGATAGNYGFATAGTAAAPLISALGGDLLTAADTGQISYKVIGSAPNRVLVVEFHDMTIIFDPAINTADGTFQVRLRETTGAIEFVYGPMFRNASDGSQAGNPPSLLGIGFSGGAASGSLVSILSSTNSSSTTAPFTQEAYAQSQPIPNLNSPVDGSRRVYTMTPPAVTAPTNLTFTSVTQIAMTLNWVDSPNETNYGIFRSTDGVNYSFVASVAAGTTSFVATNLVPSTNYSWRVFAISDGSVSSALSGSQTTLAPGQISCNGSGGVWSAPGTWSGGVLPTTGDDVTIQSGCTVTVDVPTAVALDVLVQSGGTLTYLAAAANTLSVSVNLTINAGGTVSGPASGTITANVLSIGGNLTNNGTLDLSTNADTAATGLTFAGAANATFGGTGGTTDIRTLTIAKGANTSILEMNPTNFTVRGVSTDVAGFLTLTSGTLKISGTFSMTNRTFTATGYAITAASGFWLNNPNYTVAAQNGTGTVTGVFRLSQGNYNVGTAAGSALAMATGANVTIEGGTLTSSGRVAVTAAANNITYTQTGGTVTVCTVGNTSAALGSFDLGANGAASTSVITMSGGTVIVQNVATAIDYRMDTGPTLAGLTNTTVQLGNALTGGARAFNIRGVVPNLTIDGTFGHTVTLNNGLVHWFHVATGNVLINPGTTLDLGGDATSINFFFQGQNFVNNGTLNGSNASMKFRFAGLNAQTYSGSGVMTAPLNDMSFEDFAGVTFTPTNQQVVNKIELLAGNVTGASKLTLGNGGATVNTIQIGNLTAVASLAGSFDGPLTFNLGPAGESVIYGNVNADRSTGGEINPARSLASLVFDTQAANVTIAGGDLTVTGQALLGSGATNGRIITGANTLIMGSGSLLSRVIGHVDGNLRKTFTAAGAQNFEVGTANGYSPVTVNATTGTFPSNFTARAVQGPQPNITNPAKALSRYWKLTGSGITADLTFSYLDPPDVPGTATEANFVLQRYNGTFTAPGGTVNTTANTANITGVSSFATDWTLAEPGAIGSPTPTATATATPTAGPGAISGTVTYGNAQPAATRFVSNVLISGVGSPNVSTTTGTGTGTYTLTGFGSGAYTVTPSKSGAANNAISSFDAGRVAQHAAGINVLTGNALVVADVSGGGGVSSFDAGLVARYAAGLQPPPANLTGNWIFQPANRSYASVTTAITGQDYSALLMGEVSGNWTDNGTRPASSGGPERSTAVTAPRLVTPADSDIVVPVNVQGAANKGIISYEFDLRYDASVIQPQANPVELASTVSSKLTAVANAEEPGLLRVVVYGAMPIKANGVLLNLRFTAIGAAGSVSPLTFDRVMFNEGDPRTIATDGQIELSKAAANAAEISGRLLTTMGQGIANARVTLTDTTGNSRSILSNGFGVYRFGELQVGQTYTVSVDSARFTFAPLTVSITDRLFSMDMIAEK